MKRKYSFKQTLEKILLKSMIVILVGIVSVYENEPTLLFLMPLFLFLLDYLKHREDGIV